MSLALINRLEFTDLVTPTTFPRPPQGTTGLLVFAYTASSLGVPGGIATPNAEWNQGPGNFFNDFAGCAGGKTSDCYRWELFNAPLYAGTTSETRTVGFDVDKSAQEVSAYIVVAADLRDNARQTLAIDPQQSNCGVVFNVGFGAEKTIVDGPIIQVATFPAATPLIRGFCSFSLAAVPSDASILSATLKVTETSSSGVIALLGPTVVDHLDYGTLDDNDFDLAPLTANIGTFPVADGGSLRTLDVKTAVLADRTAGRTRSQFRLHLTDESAPNAGDVIYSGPTGSAPPQLVIVYRNP